MIAPSVAGIHDPRGMAMSRLLGISSVSSWWASAEMRQIVASGRRVAASIMSRSAGSASAVR
ncbi:hypothetical protein ET989_01345 [Propioniciclava sinopodophylli]|uniref:Uncharacterized protein n=1 Tax=Propioniciclava sinopodophylli TaxID=1837344 RepID=A0A4Q9KHT7_9ACTN|nr:hypothetical protein ET989_01345 [Propioniciclava sinopodophylli]